MCCSSLSGPTDLISFSLSVQMLSGMSGYVLKSLSLCLVEGELGWNRDGIYGARCGRDGTFTYGVR